jgi:hypothetical protein
MIDKYERMIRQELRGIQEAVRTAPSGTRNKVSNRCSKVSLIVKKLYKIMDAQQKYIARQAIFEAMTGGRKLSQMDCQEFEIEDMRTPMSHMKDRFLSAGYELNSQWIQTPKGRRIKEYWLERRADIC